MVGQSILFSTTSCQSNHDTDQLTDFPLVTEQGKARYFGLLTAEGTATICYDAADAKVVGLSVNMLADDVERVTGKRPVVSEASDLSACTTNNLIVAGTIGKSALIDHLAAEGLVDLKSIENRWEAFTLTTITLPSTNQRVLVVAGSDRRGTAFGLTSLSRAMGVSPWYWWADVTPSQKHELYVQNGRYTDDGPSVQYRGIFINDERFGGWAKWVENTFDTETHKVGPKVYVKVFELLLRLKGNYLWPAMHPGTQAFNADPENARLADEYAIVMGTSHCEQMLRNNEGEWKAVDEQARREGRPVPFGDFNYITNRKTMQDYWETRVKTNGKYENTYTLGLRGIHDYPMEGANSTAERVKLMQQAIDDQRDMLRRNIDCPIEEIPQVLCTYEEVLDAYHNGLQVPDDVTMLWSDDKQGYTRNLCNPDEMKRKGGAGIYYHISYHGDPASWLWLSPLSPSFISNELTKAYTFGAQKIWVFNVGDIKPAEKELSFAMDLAWDVDQWSPVKANGYIRQWAAETFGQQYAYEIAALQATYYRLMAAGKDSHVWFVEYTEQEIENRIESYRNIAERAEALSQQIPDHLKNAYFELVLYPIHGAQMLNEYQLKSRLSLAHATAGRMQEAINEGNDVVRLYDDLNQWTKRYNEQLLDGKWRGFFNWRPYHWIDSDKIDVEYCTPQLAEALISAPKPQLVDVKQALSAEGVKIESTCDGQVKLWVKALTPVRNFAKDFRNNVFGRVLCGNDNFEVAAMPINNVWHSPLVGPRWCEVGTLHLQEGINQLRLTDVVPEACIDEMFIGLYPPLPAEPLQRIAAHDYESVHNVEGIITRIEQLGFSDGITVLPFDTPSYEVENAPYVEYSIDITADTRCLEVRTLPTLHVYEGRDARYAVQIDDSQAEIFSIHEGDFTSEWRLNVLRGYATRTLSLQSLSIGKHKVRVYLLDPGIVLEEILIK